MTKKEYAERNIGMTFDFIRHLIEHPGILNTMTNKSELDFINKGMPTTYKEKTTKKKFARYMVKHVFEPVNL